MGAAKHTKGPWTVGVRSPQGGSRGETWDIFELGDVLVFPAPGQAGPVAIVAGIANARMIAAAPDMLDALHDLLTRPTDGAARQRARDVIAKVEGRS